MSYSKDYRYKFKKMCENIGIFNAFEVGAFMKIDGELYNVLNISKNLFRFGGQYDVFLSVFLKDNQKKTMQLFLTKTTYWLQGNQNAQKAISELKYEVIADMTDELFYEKPLAKTYGSYDLSKCVGSSIDK